MASSQEWHRTQRPSTHTGEDGAGDIAGAGRVSGDGPDRAWRTSPVPFAFKAKREAALGEKPAESTVEVSGGLAAQVSDSVPPSGPPSHRLCCFSSQVLINASPARLTILPISRDTIKSYC